MNLRMLIVEDDPMVMEIHKQFIDRANCFDIVGTASTGTDAIDAAVHLKPQIIMLDIYLPDMDGLTILKELRRLEIPSDVILITAARDSYTIKEAFRYGAVDYIVKPFKYERLKQALDIYTQMNDCLGGQEYFSQEEIDRLGNPATKEVTSTLSTTSFEDMKDLPKGLNELTLRQIVLYLLKQTDGKSAEEVAEGIGLARVTARRYLEFLETVNKVKLEVQYGSVGRPVNRYRPIR
ncbi:two-component system response regulator [Desulfuribacillus stibiiarsenatis]|uniref:Transcriptional regulatory protein n=1 Tax=Desulfuribacillus stibiiarsenatis TaxID=1390249 RepID=A0A1E5L876_9FIRM|nr:response regulator [Desulfuribacillus stibiiarsenatis]OEH86362.1 two-component system response regulator [Desulfuribacillus stibiiarsenatis]